MLDDYMYMMITFTMIMMMTYSQSRRGDLDRGTSVVDGQCQELPKRLPGGQLG